MAKLRIVFDGYWWTNGPFSNRTVLVNLVHEWGRFYPEDQLTVIYPGKKFAVSDSSGVHCIQVPWLPHPFFNLIYVWPYSILCSCDYSLVQNFGIFSRKSLVFIHDVIFLERKEWFSKLELFYFSLIPRLAKARQVEIVTSSEAESRRIEFHLKPKNVTPVGLGVRLTLTEATPIRPKSLENSQGAFYFTVGRSNPRKNLVRLIQAHGLACQEIRNFPDLIIVGVTSDEMPGMGFDSCLGESVKFLTNLSDSELRWLYENGDFTAFLSLDEGFGLPMKEADFFQIPQLVSDLEVFHEVASESAVFVNPISVDEIKHHIINLSKTKRQTRVTGQLVNHTWQPVISSIRVKFEELGSKS